MALMPHQSPPPPPPAVVPTAKKVITTAPPSPPAAPPAAPAAAPSSVEQARQGVVVVERQGKALALATVLEGDGRLLTALSPLTTGNFLSARYADGAVVPLKLVHSDRAWDLALLAPSASPAQPLRKAGLRAAKTPSFVGLQSFTLTPPNSVAVVPAALKLSPGLLGGDGAALSSAYELGSKPGLVGAPIVNSEGEVVAVVARACPPAGKAACVPAPYGAPVGAVKQFLQRVPAEATWLGVETAADDSSGQKGLRVISVSPDGPAAFAGIRSGRSASESDIIIAIDGAPLSTPSDLNDALRAHAPGDSVELLLFGFGRYRHINVKPRTVPQASKSVAPNPYRR
ncbi:MAG TPA: S1C family serine protease [Polyangiaceae bacterium]|nr:S1C family serine protease [Polyangiaceae bacterium]